MVNRNTFRCDDCFKFGKIFWLKSIGSSKKFEEKKKPEFLPTLVLQLPAFDDERFRIHAIAVNWF